MVPPRDASPPPSPLSMAQAASRGDRIREALQQAILDGALAQGAPLVERELAERLGVSKTPVREALKQLQSSGLVVANAYQRVSVRRLDARTVRDLHTARLGVEPHAVRLGVELLGAGAVTAARTALAEADGHLARDETAQLGLANRRFHRALYERCGNEWLISFLDKLQVLNTFVATAGWRVAPTFSAEALEHRGLLRVVEEGDAERAESLIRAHIAESSQALLATLDDDVAPVHA